jgi:predicted AlkP superfamily phosphohydrolase/phosphomutase
MQGFMDAPLKAGSEIGRIYRSADRFIGTVMGKGHDIIIVSDHGFQPIRKCCFINQYLMRRGLLALRKENPLRALLRVAGISREKAMGMVPLGVFEAIYRSRIASSVGRRLTPPSSFRVDEIDPARSAVFAMDSVGAIHVRPGVDTASVISMLEALEDDEGNKVIKKVHARDDIYHGDFTADAPALIAIPADGMFLRSHVNASLGCPLVRRIEPGKELNGSHSEFGVFIAYGQGFARKGRMEDLSLLDITPTILSYMGFSLPARMDGRRIPLFGVDGGQAARTSLAQETRLLVRGLARKRSGRG